MNPNPFCLRQKKKQTKEMYSIVFISPEMYKMPLKYAFKEVKRNYH